METKRLITIGILVCSSLGAWAGSLLDNGNIFGLWAILLGGAGGLAGIWIGYQIGNNL